MESRCLLPLVCALGILATGCVSFPRNDPSTLRGRVSPGASGPVLIYLEPISAPVSGAPTAPKTVALRRSGDLIQPTFVVASIDQVLAFSNVDDVHHAIFSESEPNAFQLGTLAIGETRPIAFASAGPVRFYCSLHESEHGVIFVAPSPHRTLVDADGEYALVGVPPGRYRLHAWSDTPSNFEREITLQPGQSAWREVELAPGRSEE